MSRLVRVAFFFLICLVSQPLFAQSIWNADAVNGTTDWNTAANWINGVPAAGKIVFINKCTNCPTISTNGNQSAYIQINDGGQLTINSGGSLTVQTSAGSGLKTYINSVVTINTGGSLNVQGFTNEGLAIGGTFKNTGNLIVNGSHTGIAIAADASLSNNIGGNINITSTTLDFGLTNAGTVLNNGSISIDNSKIDGISQQNGTFINSKTGTLNITKTGVNAVFSQSNFINNGTLNIDNSSKGIYVIFGTFNNNTGSKLNIKGSTALKEGIYVGQATFNNSGELTVDSSQFLSIEVSDSATFNNKGKLLVTTKGDISILNVGRSSFTNFPCAYIQSNAQIVNYATFKNSGYIKEESSGTSMISFNDGTIYNLNGGNFNVTSGSQPSKTLTNIWTGCSSAAWENPQNWASNAVPVAVGNTLPAVVIPDVSKTSGNTPILNTEARVSQIDIQANAALTIGTKGNLTVTAFLTTPEPLNLNKASSLSIQEGGQLNAFKINNNQGLISNLGTIKITGSGILSGIENNSGTLNNSGTINNSRLTNNGDALNLGQFTNSEFIVNNSSFSNSGLLTAGSGIALQNYGTFINYTEGVINISNVEKGIQSDNIFNNLGRINIDGTTNVGIVLFAGTFTNAKGAIVNISRTQMQSFFSFGNIINSGALNIFDTQNSGLVVSGTCSNKTTGVINHTNVSNGMVVSGNFSNEGKVKIDKSNTRGLETGASGTITNETTGSIDISQTRTEGLAVFANLMNKGSIKILNAGTNGFTNSGTSVNDVGGVMDINNAGTNGLTNNATFKNNGNLTVNNAAIQGIINQSGSLDNSGSGKITSNGAGLNGLINRSFVNNLGFITAEGSGLYALFNDSIGIFNNQSCGEVTLKARFRNTGTFNNEALLRLASDDTPSNPGTLINTGIIEDPNNSFEIIRYTNNALRVRPIAGNVGAAIPNALEVANNTFTQIGTTWFTNASLTDIAGTYNRSQNTFTSKLNGGNYKFYFSVNNIISNCNKVVSIPVSLIGTASELRVNKPVVNTIVNREKADLTIFPNPAAYEINLEMKGNISADATIQIFDQQGKQVYAKKIGYSEEANLSVDVSNFSVGIYLLSIQKDGKNMVTKRFVVGR